MPDRYEEALARIAGKFRKTAEAAAEAGIIPYQSAEGRWIASPYDGNSWWTGGFWPGLMWQLWQLTGDEFFQLEARRVEKLLTDEFRSFRRLNHDVGFMYLLSCGADAKLTGDDQAETDTLHAASLLMGRFNPAGFIRAWNEPERTGYAIIDCMMNLTLLYRASRDTGDPRFRQVAKIHADTTLREFLRDDGSVRLGREVKRLAMKKGQTITFRTMMTENLPSVCVTVEMGMGADLWCPAISGKDGSLLLAPAFRKW